MTTRTQKHPSCARRHYELHVRDCDALNIIDLFRAVWAAFGMIPAVLDAQPVRRAYDHRLREHVVRCGARTLARNVHIPRSTISTWRRRGIRPVVMADPLGDDLHHDWPPATSRASASFILLGQLRVLTSGPEARAQCVSSGPWDPYGGRTELHSEGPSLP